MRIFLLQISFVTAILTFVSVAQTVTGPSATVLDPSSIDRSVDPCADLYAFSCGNWIKNNPIPPDQDSWGISSKLQEDTNAELRDILQEAAKNSQARGSYKKIGDYYASCMDETAIEAQGTKPLYGQVKRLSELRSKRELANWIAEVAAQDPQGFVFLYHSIQDYKQSSQIIGEIDQGGLGLPDRDYYLKADAKSIRLRKQYVAHVRKMFALLGGGLVTAAMEAQAVLRVETALAKGSQSRVQRRDPNNLNHKMTLKQLTTLAPNFAWSRYFEKLGTPGLVSFNVASPGFFRAANVELQKESLTDWKTYLRWHLVHANAENLSSAFVNENFAFFGTILRGVEQLKPRWKRCVDSTDQNLGEALGQAYVEMKFPPEAKQRALSMVKGIRDAMENDLHNLPWMGDTTRKQALEKLHSMANKVGYPDQWRDYRSLNVDRGSFAEDAMRAASFEYARRLAKIGKPLDRGEWDMTPPTVNAYYDGQMNDINFPAGILQPPLFDARSDDAPNYGNTGGTIGHELTHGFDDEGSRFDAAGNLRDWWTPADAREFKKRTACIAKQYAQYTIVDDIKINSQLTLGEDVADLGGLILAYAAWKEARQKPDSIDGFTPEQRFFISFAQSWCTNDRDQRKRLRATVDPHSPEKYRANGVVSNMPEFQQAFQCKANSAMANTDRCRVW